MNHKGQYAALNVSGANVVRFNGKNSYYNGRSYAYNYLANVGYPANAINMIRG